MASERGRLIARGAYRTRQFWHTIWARQLSDAVQREVELVLTDRLLALFLDQSKVGQQHGYRVMSRLVEDGQRQSDLLVAALLHDVGKATAHYTWFDRVKVVLFEGQLYEKEIMDRLKTLPSREELVAKMLGGLKSPLTQTVMVLKGMLRNLVGLLDAIAKEKGEEAGETAEAEPISF